MKLTLIQDLAVPETEITIRCAGIDARLQRLIDHIRQYGFSITGYQDNKRIPASIGNDLLYGFRRWPDFPVSERRRL